MLINLEEVASDIASKVDGARLTPVIEKEIIHYEIIRSLGRNGLLRDITFQGGTSLRLCYGSQRYSEDLDFVAGDRFDSLPLDDFSKTLRSDLLKSYDTEVSVREPKVVNDFDGVGMRRWTVSVNTNIARPDLPKQRIKLEIASVPAHTSTIRRVAVNIPNLPECMTTSRSGARHSRKSWPTSSSHSPPPIHISGIATSGTFPGSSVHRRSISLP